MEETVSISGTLLMLDDTTSHVAVPVQAICKEKVVATVLSDAEGRYQFIDLRPGIYQVRCQVLGGYVYYREKCSRETEDQKAGQSDSRMMPGKPISLKVEQGKTLKNMDFRFAPFKKGVWRNYTYLDGLSHNFIHAIHSDSDGAMWFGSWQGVSRYDGKEFFNLSEEDGLATDDVSAVYCDPDGILWIGTGDWFRHGKGISRYDGSEIINLSEEDGLVNNTVFAIHRAPNGSMWFGTGGGVSCYNGEKFVNFTTEDGLASNDVSAIYCDPNGVVWIGTGGWSRQGKGASLYNGKVFTRLTVENGLASNNIYAIHRGSDGVMWFGTAGGVSRYDGKEFVNLTEEDGLVNNTVLAVHSDPDGVMWFGTMGGVSRYDGRGVGDFPHFVNFTEADGLSGESISSIHSDLDGAIWFGTWGNGVSRYSSSDFINLNTKDGLASDHTRAAYCDPDGTIWVAGECISRLDKDHFADLGIKRDPTRLVYGIHRTPDGKLWFATGKGDIFCYDGKELSDFASEIGMRKNFRAIHGNSDGVIWLGTSGDGVYWYDGREITNFTKEHGLASDQVWAIHCDDDGVTWFGTWGGGVSRYDGKKFTNLTSEDGLASDNIFSIYRAPDGIIWFGTLHRGLSCYNGRDFTNISAKDGLTSNTIRAIHCDQEGVMYFGTQGGGVSCYDGDTWMSLDVRDGLAGNNVYSIHQIPDGRLLLATERGVTLYRRSDLSPKVYISSVTTDQIYRDVTNIPTLNCGTRVTIEYSSIDFKTLPDKRQYRCRIREIDSDWRESTKATSFDYTFKDPGEYNFEVQAIDRDLNYSKPATVKLSFQANPDLIYLQTQLSHLRREAVEKYYFDNIIGRSISIRQVRALMEKAIDSGLTVLITGETGTGKELVAKAIHYNSSRRAHPLLDLNCGAVPRELVASTLFGHRKGAFTGARDDKMGLFEAASGGTLLLDEIGEMPEEAQLHLLRVLQERKIHRIGETQLRGVNVRVIAITKRDLEAEVRAGHFREDLYYRLSVFPIHVPPLRERVEDIPLLAEYFLQKICDEQSKKLGSFAPGVMDMLKSYSWPGNVRELEHEIYRAAALAEVGTQIQVYHFSSRVTQGESLIQEILSERIRLSEAIETLQKRMIENALRESAGNQTQAAKILGIRQPNLSRLMKRLGIDL